MKKIAIIYGSASNGVQKKALEVLTKSLLNYTIDYPTCIAADQPVKKELFGQLIYIGTKENNPYLAAMENHPTATEGYTITVKDGVVYIEGKDDGGVLYGCVDFYAKYLTHAAYTDEAKYYWLNPFRDEFTLPDASLSSSPSIKNRGLWTWGHVVYDYRGYIDHLVMMKMNTLIIWNDFVPVNIDEIIDYAHNANVKLYLGYPWGWDHRDDLFNIQKLMNNTYEQVVEEYKREYAHLNIDGIYFQTVTETEDEMLDGMLIAEAVTAFVNKTASALYAIKPDLELQFGLHATSVNKRLEYLKKVDPRIHILWENCGSFPFNYIPKDDIDKFDDTEKFVREIANLRGDGERFGVVTKAFVRLNWEDFEHQRGRYVMGISSDKIQNNRVEHKHVIWRYMQAYWLTHADKAYQMIRAMKEETGGDMFCTALVEDSMIEKDLIYLVALYGEMLWDTDSDADTLITEVALREDVVFL